MRTIADLTKIETRKIIEKFNETRGFFFFFFKDKIEKPLARLREKERRLKENQKIKRRYYS